MSRHENGRHECPRDPLLEFAYAAGYAGVWFLLLFAVMTRLWCGLAALAAVLLWCSLRALR